METNLKAAEDILKTVFGFDSLRPGQDQAVAAVLSGQDVLAVMPTGAGKSLCFQLPALTFGGLTIVVSPLIALMQDQVAGLKLLGIAAEAINSSQSREQNVDIWKRAAAGDIKLLYMSPEMLMTERMLAALSRIQPSLIAVDEVHCMSQWGAAFRPEYAQLRRLQQVFPDTPLIGLTATADAKTRMDIKNLLFAKPPVEVGTGFDRPNLRLMVEQRVAAKKQLPKFLDERRGQSGIVYCLSRRKTEEVAADLCAEGHTALAFHAGLETGHKSHVLERFMSEPGLIIVATIAFGMGIDKPDIRFVAHADLPSNMEAYYQEIGRAGRDGEPADCLLLWGGNDINQRRRFITEENSSEEHKRQSQQRLSALMGYVDAPNCRRFSLLNYFGDEQADRFDKAGCGNCDLCLNPAQTQDETDKAKQVAQAIQETGTRFGTAHICDVLLGASNDKITKFNHQDLPVFGAGKAHNATFWRNFTRQMQSAGLIDIDLANFNRAVATPKLTALVNGEGRFLYRAPQDVKSSGGSSGGSSGKGSGPSKAKAPAVALAPDEDALLVDLKTLRRELAAERKVPAFVIFSDRTLIDMVVKKPQSPGAFLEVNGVGAAKRDAFAEAFLAVIAKHAA